MQRFSVYLSADRSIRFARSGRAPAEFEMRMRTAGVVILLAVLAIRPAPAQENSPIDLTGTWRWINHEDERDRNPGAFPGDYRGLPLNDAARMRADTYDEEVNTTSSLLQCRPRTPGYQPKGLDPMRIDKVIDPLTRQLVAYRISYEKTAGERVIWLDGRPTPSPYALHSWEGFSTGKFRGDTLEITTTHLKESYVRRNGVATSFRATVIEHISLEEPYLEVTFTVIDPDYLTEPLVRSATYMRAPTLQLPPYPCQPEENQAGEKYRVPHYLPGENPYLTESGFKYKTPQEGVRGGADTLYPEWRARGVTLAPPATQSTIKPIYTDASTHIAERADALRPRTPVYDKVEAVHVAGNVYLIAGAGGNIVVSAGGDGIVMVDSGATAASDRVLAAVRQIHQALRPPEMPESASPFGNTWQADARVSGADDSDDHQYQQQPGSCGWQREHQDVSAVPSPGLPGSVAEPAGARARRGPTPDGGIESPGPCSFRPTRTCPTPTRCIDSLTTRRFRSFTCPAPLPTATAWSGSAARTPLLPVTSITAISILRSTLTRAAASTGKSTRSAG